MPKRKYKVNPRKTKLIELSGNVKMMLKMNSEELEGFDGEPTINNLVKYVYYPKGAYNTYKGWSELGYQVKKKSKSFTVWSRKRKMTKKVENEQGDTEEQKYSAFGIASIFHESQVEKIAELAEVN